MPALQNNFLSRDRFEKLEKMKAVEKKARTFCIIHVSLESFLLVYFFIILFLFIYLFIYLSKPFSPFSA